MVGPPLAVLPVLSVVGVVLVTPIRFPRNPVRMIGIEEVQVVIMQPVGATPIAGVIVAI